MSTETRLVKLKDKHYNAGNVVASCVVAIVPTGNMSCEILLQGGHKLVVEGPAQQLVEDIFGG